MPAANHPLLLKLQRRAAALEAAFNTVAATRMAGLPVMNPVLRVQALGFALHADGGDGGPAWGLGVLVTPWFMNLVRLPLAPAAAVPAVGCSTPRRHAGLVVDFIAAHEPAVGDYEACSLFSPMFQFADAAAAEAVANEVLRQLRAPSSAPVAALPPAASATAPAAATRRAAPAAMPPTPPMPARRGFLLARRGDGAAP